MNAGNTGVQKGKMELYEIPLVFLDEKNNFSSSQNSNYLFTFEGYHFYVKNNNSREVKSLPLEYQKG